MRIVGAAALTGCSPAAKHPLPPGDLLGMNHALGHRLRDGGFPPPSETRKTGVLIVGGGISGLSAAWKLANAAVDDFLLLEMESEVGGNSRAGQSQLVAYPWGAHYLPLPTREAVHVRDLLAELGVLQGDPAALRPIYDERYLCATPQERVYRNGFWEEGLLPHRGLDTAERAQQKRFQQQMEVFKRAIGRDGRRAFAIPMALSSSDPAWRELDRISFAQWLNENGFTAKTVHWLANYACRDDFGMAHDQVSAWAGLHYFACRNGEAGNAANDAVLTAPEGNAWLARGLARKAGARVLTGAMVWHIEEGKSGVSVDALVGEKSIRFEAQQLIWAAPAFVLPRVWPGIPEALKLAALAGDYAPWLVANLHLDTPREAWAEGILSELERVHPDIRKLTTRLDVFRHGHAMRRPVPGSLFHGQREKMANFENLHISLAHADLSGFSLFEEAQYRGVLAAERVMRRYDAR